MAQQRVLFGILSAALAGSALLPATARSEETAPTLANLRESARKVVARHCGECHVKGAAAAVPNALAIFDLTEANWSAHLSSRQLSSAKRRLLKSADGAEQKTFDAFIAAELKASPSTRWSGAP